MQHDSVTIQCPNMNCRAANPEEQTFCLNCHTRLPKRYLKVVNFSDQEFAPGSLLADRFIFRGPQVVLDLRPGLLLTSDYEVPDLFLPYLKLFPYRIHYSQLFTILWVGESEQAPILLLDQAPLCPFELEQPEPLEGEDSQPSVPIASALPLQQAWPQARPIRQLHWLWQITRLWNPFLAQGVTQSLITPTLLRVEGPMLRVLELHNDPPTEPPTLRDLGAMLSQLKSGTSDAINLLFDDVCDELVKGKITETTTLAIRLEDFMMTCRDSQAIQVSLATQTDPGVVRSHNEDQCFPASGSYIQDDPQPLLIVCDGVGGHEGGEVASAIAIEAIQQHLNNLILDTLSPAQIKQELTAACCHANDLISERNDQEQRQERARMGTTLVLALLHEHQLYIAHVGDSRAYLITKVGCYQLTVDDDIASREVRLGYVPYQEALRQPTSGSLVQALGMASSNTLHPNIQRFLVDDACVLLLCSDGLSDYDRVEELWQEELLPLLYRNYELSSISQRLISLANHLNGHDNVTVGLMNMAVDSKEISQQPTLKRDELDFGITSPNLNAIDGEGSPSGAEASPTVESDSKLHRQKRTSSPFILPIIIGVVVALVGGAIWAALTLISRPDAPTEVPTEAENLPDLPEPPPIPTPETVQPNQFFEVSNATGLTVQLEPITPLEEDPAVKTLPQGTVIKVITEQSAEGSDVENLLMVEICKRPDTTVSNSPDSSPITEAETPAIDSEAPALDSTTPIEDPLEAGKPAWVETTKFQENATPIITPDLSQFGRGICQAPSGDNIPSATDSQSNFSPPSQ